MLMMRKPTLDDFIKMTYNEKYHSVWTVVTGPNQSGKTDLNLFIMERCQKLGLYDAYGANMPIAADFEIDFIEDLQTLKRRCEMLNPDPARYGLKRYLFLGSEMGTWLPKDQPWENVEFIRQLQQVRKYGLSFIGDGIDRIDSRVINESFFHGKYEKISKSKPQFARYYDWTTRKRIKLSSIPRTRLGFDTFYKAMFYMMPQTKEGAIIPLSPEHEIVRKYLDCGSWKAAGIHAQEGKRAVAKVLEHHFTHCLSSLPVAADSKAED